MWNWKNKITGKENAKKSGVRRGLRHARSGRGGTRHGVRSRPVRSPCVPRFVIFHEHDTLARPRLHPDRRFGAVRRARLHHRGVVVRAPRRIGVSLVTGSGGVGGRPASRHRSRAREGSYGSRFDARTLRTRLGDPRGVSAPRASDRTDGAGLLRASDGSARQTLEIGTRRYDRPMTI